MVHEIKRANDDESDIGFTKREDKFLSIKIVLSVMGTILLLIFGFIGNGIVTDVKALQRDKLDKEQYFRDLGDIKDSLRSIDNFVKNHNGLH
jgi:hypothetical protein